MQITLSEIVSAKIELFKRGLSPLGPTEIPPKLIPVFEGQADIRFGVGGRGGGKSWAFTKQLATRGAIYDSLGMSGVMLCIREFMNSLDDSSLQDLKNAILGDPWLSSVYDVGERYIKTRSGRIKFIFAGTSVNLSSIKSKSKILICFAEEAEYIQGDAWEKLIPTIREEGSELWLIYNAETDRAWVHKNVRLIWESGADPLIKGAFINWDSNPWFTTKMNRDRLRALENDPDNYDHIWEGAFKTVFKGSYYTRDLTKARVDGRITEVPHDPLMTYRAYWDIGGTGAKADACTIWIAQFVGQKINALDYYEAVGQPLATHVNWLRTNGYENALCILPHDGVKHDAVYTVTYESALTDAGFKVEVVPNQGTGAANMRIEATRRIFNKVWFNDKPTEQGRKTLAAYRENWNEDRGVGLGPLHDWASNGADSFGLMAVHYEEPTLTTQRKSAGRARSWMG